MSKLALVTGGTRGIGKAICSALKHEGYKVVSNYVFNAREAERFSKEHNIDIERWDVSDFNECKKKISELEKKYERHFEILVNNAGITADSFLHKMDLKSWNKVIDTNLSSCFNTCHAVIDKMRENGFGRIVNISSINGLTGQIGQCNYSASKAGVIGFTKALAKENASKNVTVNSVAPGYTKTDMLDKIDPKILEKIISGIPAGRLAKPEEIARAVLFLLDEHSGFITGEVLSVNGGQYM